MSKTGNTVAIKQDVEMSVMDAIYKRHSVRSYKSQVVDKATVSALLDTAIHAPTAIDEQPWAFAILQDSTLLNKLSDDVKKIVGDDLKTHAVTHALDHFLKPDFNVFYKAGTLIVIYGKSAEPFVAADCWLAAENLILAACAKGLGTCVIGSAVAALNTPEWKTTLKIPATMTAIAPIILGVPSGETPPVPRKEPEILIWK